MKIRVSQVGFNRLDEGKEFQAEVIICTLFQTPKTNFELAVLGLPGVSPKRGAEAQRRATQLKFKKIKKKKKFF